MPAKRMLRFGSRVRLISTGEVGVVVHAWWDTEIQGAYYYVAFFGQTISVAKPDNVPYVLRYAETSLELS